MWPSLIGSAATHAAAARHHASTTTGHANNEQRNAHNRENILEIHIRLQAAEIGERGTTRIQLESFGGAPLIACICLFTS